MVNLSIPVPRNAKLLSKRQSEESVIGTSSTVANLDDDDLLALARGAVNGVMLSMIIWGLIAVAWWAL